MAQTMNEIAIPVFESLLEKDHRYTKELLSVIQLNLGRLCNLSCKHCHMEAGPDRTEIMDKRVMEACISVLKQNGSIETLDLTGGAPEMNPHFRWLIAAARPHCKQLIVRTNLVILLEPGYEDLPDFFREHEVDVVCSLPHYHQKSTDKMRGDWVFARSIEALKRLNNVGYGIQNGKTLNLVFNPGGAFLPSSQDSLERDFRSNLKRDFGVEFTSLFAITNNPVGRFSAFLERSGNLQSYMGKLYAAFNPSTRETMMWRGQISVGYDGVLYDCDFNQATNLPVISNETIFDWVEKEIPRRCIQFGQHCFACTAGFGSSCGGETDLQQRQEKSGSRSAL